MEVLPDLRVSDATITKTSQRKYSARVFSRAGMFCPHCQSELEEAIEACPRCDFDLSYCDKAFPFAAPPLSLVIDPSHLLPPGVEKDVQKMYQKVRKRAPQIGISFCFVRLQTGVPIEEFAFWLHNSAPSADKERAWQLLIVGDLTSGRLTMTSGYALEPFIQPELWEAALQELAACISDEQWKEGLNGFLVDTRDLITAAWLVAERRRLRNHRRRLVDAKSKALKKEKEQEEEKARAHGEGAKVRESEREHEHETDAEKVVAEDFEADQEEPLRDDVREKGVLEEEEIREEETFTSTC